MNSGIYRLEFENGQTYVGQSTNIELRISKHLESMQKGTAARKLQLAFAASNGNFRYYVLIKVHPDYLDICESYFIHTLKPGLNTTIPKVYDWDVVEDWIKQAPLLPSILDTFNSNLVEKDLSDRVKELETIADAQELRAITYERLLKSPDVVKELLSELEVARECYRLLDRAYWEQNAAIVKYNSKSWWNRLWTKV